MGGLAASNEKNRCRGGSWNSKKTAVWILVGFLADPLAPHTLPPLWLHKKNLSIHLSVGRNSHQVESNSKRSLPILLLVYSPPPPKQMVVVEFKISGALQPPPPPFSYPMGGVGALGWKRPPP